jgi:hypothetical protein
MKKKSGTPGDPKALNDLRAQVDRQNSEIDKLKKSAADSKRDKDKYKRDTCERNNPDGGTAAKKKGAGNNTAAPAPAPAAAATAAAAAANG